MTSADQSVNRAASQLRYWLLWTTLLVFVLIVSGGVVRVTGSACAGWPLCESGVLPPLDGPGLFDYLHRLATALAAPVLLLTGWQVWRWARRVAWLARPYWLALVVVGLQALVGGQLKNLPPEWGSALHFGLAIISLGLLTLVTVVAFVLHADEKQPARLALRSPFGRAAGLYLAVVFVVLVSGVWLSGQGVACNGWPLCNGQVWPGSAVERVDMLHRLAVALASAFSLWLLNRAWRTQRSQRAILSAATLAVMLFFAQGFLGAIKATRGYAIDLLGLHTVTAAALLAAAVILVAFAGLYARTKAEEDEEANWPVDWRGRFSDLLALTKPIIVALLLVTTYGGMVIGGKAFPGLALTFWTLLGGALAAGGSGAVNQYIDREVDQRMTRTAKRPLAAGRMTPAEGMAYGFGLLVIAFYLLAGFVNLLAALLSLFGMLYYVVLYSIYLKKATVQNIVIGGGAGAVPPLVGWAATTGGLDVPALLLFAIIFMWTPPHFWALAIVRQKDYAEAGIPMLPVVRGEMETRKQVLIYTLELVALTLLMWVFRFAGPFYLVCAIGLGGYLIYAAWRVWRVGGNKVAWHMYRYSSMYLAFLFLALMVDAVL